MLNKKLFVFIILSLISINVYSEDKKELGLGVVEIVGKDVTKDEIDTSKEKIDVKIGIEKKKQFKIQDFQLNKEKLIIKTNENRKMLKKYRKGYFEGTLGNNAAFNTKLHYKINEKFYKYVFNGIIGRNGGSRPNTAYDTKNFSVKFLDDSWKGLKYDIFIDYSKVGEELPSGINPDALFSKQTDEKTKINFNFEKQIKRTNGMYFLKVDRIDRRRGVNSESFKDTLLKANLGISSYFKDDSLFLAQLKLSKDNFKSEKATSTASKSLVNNELSVGLEQDLSEFIMLEWKVKYMFNSDYDSDLLPEVIFNYIIDDRSNLEVKLGQDYYLRNYDDLYFSRDYVDFNENTPIFKPEKTFIFNAIIDRKLSRLTYAKLGLFKKKIDDYIYYSDKTQANPIWSINQMNDSTTITGFNTLVKHNLKSNLDIIFKYNYKNLDASVNIPYIPEETMSIDFNYVNVDGIRLNINQTYVGPVYFSETSSDKLTGFSTFNVNGDKMINEAVKVFFSVNNILNNEYQVRNQYLMPGRTIILGSTIWF